MVSAWSYHPGTPVWLGVHNIPQNPQFEKKENRYVQLTVKQANNAQITFSKISP